MKFDDTLQRVDPRWRQEFGEFLATGRASEEFLDYFDASPEAQEAADEILVAVFEPFEKLLQQEQVEGARRRTCQTDS